MSNTTKAPKVRAKKQVNGTTYNASTPAELVRALENARANRSRVRVFLGDTETGRDWLEENDVCGRLGRSTGTEKIPLLIPNARSMGGGALLDDCILRLIVNGREVWRASNYTAPTFETKSGPLPDLPFEVFVNGQTEPHARFKTGASAARWVAFMKGERMGK